MLDILPEDKPIVMKILNNHLPANAKVWVFGSRIRGDAKPFSDLDLAVDLGEPLSAQQLADLAFDFEESDLPYKVDIVDWNSITSKFKKNIEKDCLLLMP